MKKKWKNLMQSLRFRLLIYTLLISVFSLSVTVVIMSYMSVSNLIADMEGTVKASAGTIKNEMERLLTDADTTLKHLQLNQTLITYAKEIRQSELTGNYFTQHAPVSSFFADTFVEMLVQDDHNCSIKYISEAYDNIGYYYPFGSRKYTSTEELQNIDTLNDLFEHVKYVDYLPPHEDYWDIRSNVFSVARMMRDPYHIYGILLYDYNVSELDHMLDNFSEDLHSSVTLLDKDQIVYSSADGELQKEILKAVLHQGEEGVAMVGKHDISGYLTSDLTEWTVVYTCRTEQYEQARMRMIRTVIFLYAAALAVLFMVLYIITGRLTDPLHRLTKQITKQDPSDLDLAPIPSKSWEVTVLSEAIRAYLQRIDLQNRKIEEANQRAVSEHYKTLEAQLNPHFLYNTLAVIAMEGLETDNMDVFEMCSRLSNLLRYSLTFSGQSVTIKNEIENVRNYLFIMEKRFENRLVVSWHTDPSIEKIEVPKLILQPLVENCFQHGFHNKEEIEDDQKWEINIRTLKDECHWYIEVSNNGAVFPEEKIRYILEEYEQSRELFRSGTGSKPVGYGLNNTLRRLHIFYSGLEVIRIHSTEELTTICIGGPL